MGTGVQWNLRGAQDVRARRQPSLVESMGLWAGEDLHRRQNLQVKQESPKNSSN